MDKATPRPWKVQNNPNYALYIFENELDGRTICEFSFDHGVDKANAELIVKAVNRDHLFDELVELLKNITKEQSIPDFERSIAEAREFVNERLTKAAK